MRRRQIHQLVRGSLGDRGRPAERLVSRPSSPSSSAWKRVWWWLFRTRCVALGPEVSEQTVSAHPLFGAHAPLFVFDGEPARVLRRNILQWCRFLTQVYRHLTDSVEGTTPYTGKTQDRISRPAGVVPRRISPAGPQPRLQSVSPLTAVCTGTHLSSSVSTERAGDRIPGQA